MVIRHGKISEAGLSLQVYAGGPRVQSWIREKAEELDSLLYALQTSTASEIMPRYWYWLSLTVKIVE